MARLIYSAITSLDGYVADEQGSFDWAAPDEEVHAFVNDQERPIGTYLYGRKLYEVMQYWEAPPDTGVSAVADDYAAIWQAADKVVYSRTLTEPSTTRTRVEREFDPAAVRAMKASAGADIGIGGAHLAAEALRAGVIDGIHLFVNPVLVGGGNAALPDGVRVDLDLVAERRFGSGVVHLHYRVRS